MPFHIEYRWKEEVIYWEGNRGFRFEGGWGASPPVTYVPDEASWDGVVPEWMKGRRPEIVGRLAAYPSHIEEDSSWPIFWDEVVAEE